MTSEIDRLRSAMEKFDYPDFMIKRVIELTTELQHYGVHTERFVRRLSECLSDREFYIDIFKEGRFALALAKSGFKDIALEYKPKGPDILASHEGQKIYFDVTRKRSNTDEWAEENDAFSFGGANISRIITKISIKKCQFIHGALNVVVLWSDTITWGEREVEEAFGYITQEREQTKAYEWLSGLLFTEGGVNLSKIKQFKLLRNKNALMRIGDHLAIKLESLLERDREEWQKEIDEMTEALRKIKNLK